MSKAQAGRYGLRLVQLTPKNGRLHPSVVVQDAKSLLSPLHDWFEWNDQKAAKKHRLNQARELIRSIDIVELSSKKRHRAFVQVEKIGYRYTPEIIDNVDLIAVVYRDLLERMRYWLRESSQWEEHLSIEIALAKRIADSLSRRLAKRKDVA